jgi:hypothetical protein
MNTSQCVVERSDTITEELKRNVANGFANTETVSVIKTGSLGSTMSETSWLITLKFQKRCMEGGQKS